MTYTVEDIVDVQISVADRVVEAANFSIPLILDDQTVKFGGTDTFAVVTSTEDVLALTDGTGPIYTEADAVYRMVSLIKQQPFAPRDIKIALYDSTASGTPVGAVGDTLMKDTQWFYILCTDHTDATIEAIAAWAEANKKIYLTSSSSADIITSGTTDIANTLCQAEYSNTFLMYDPNADGVVDSGTMTDGYSEAAPVGTVAGLNPGSTTLFAKTLTGVKPVNITRTQAEYAIGKNANIYTNIGGLGFDLWGTMTSGRFFDIVWGYLALQARMEEAVVGLLYDKSNSGSKVDFDLSGLKQIEAEMRKVLDLFASDSYRFVAVQPVAQIYMPSLADISKADRSQRILNNVEFEATLRGAIQRTKIRGYLEV